MNRLLCRISDKIKPNITENFYFAIVLFLCFYVSLNVYMGNLFVLVVNQERMKLHTWLIIFVLTLGRIAYAYPNEIFERKVVLNEKDFDLNDDFPFFFDQLINAQNEKYFLGKDLTSGNYSFNNFIENELSDFFKKKMPSKGKKEPLIIKINRITQSGFSPNSSVDLSITFYTKADNSYIEVLQTASFTYLRWNSVFGNEERKRGEVILNAFKKCFLDLQNRFESGSLRNRVVSMDELSIVAHFDEKTFPILAPKFKAERGLFHNFSDFIDLNLDTSIYFYLRENDTKKSDLKYVFAQPVSADIWGGFDGENFFIRFADRFFKLDMLEGKLFMILNHADARSLEVDHGISIGRAGYTLSVVEHTKKSLVYRARIDWYSGRFIRENLEMAIINSSNKKWGDLTFYLNGEKLGMLKRNEFFRIEYIPPSGMSLLEVRSNEYSERIWFNPLIETMIRVKQNQNGIRIIDLILISENDKPLYLNSISEVEIEESP